jgi:hypothetical protein
MDDTARTHDEPVALDRRREVDSMKFFHLIRAAGCGEVTMAEVITQEKLARTLDAALQQAFAEPRERMRKMPIGTALTSQRVATVDSPAAYGHIGN